ncbi:hypothetical protein DOY81_013368, partial [Sarcophaga bullata]
EPRNSALPLELDDDSSSIQSQDIDKCTSNSLLRDAKDQSQLNSSQYIQNIHGDSVSNLPISKDEISTTNKKLLTNEEERESAEVNLSSDDLKPVQRHSQLQKIPEDLVVMEIESPVSQNSMDVDKKVCVNVTLYIQYICNFNV